MHDVEQNISETIVSRHDLNDIRKNWDNKLNNLLNQKKLSQVKFVNEFNKKYRSDGSGAITQKLVSNWLNLENKGVGFPKFENIINIADFFNVDVGFLIGETNMVAFDIEKACEFMNLSPQAVKKLNSLTVEPSWRMGFSKEEGKSVIDSLITSEYFVEFIKILVNAKRLIDEYNARKPLKVLASEISAERFNKAYEIYQSSIDWSDDKEAASHNITKQQQADVAMFDAAVSKEYDYYKAADLQLTSYKSELQDLFNVILDDKLKLSDNSAPDEKK